MYFVDSSALIKAYIPERGSITVQEAFRRLDGYLFTSTLVAIETLAGFARLLRSRDLTRKSYAAARTDFLNHLHSRYVVVPVPEPVLHNALALVDRYRERGIGGADLVHICTAESLRASAPTGTVALMCCDRRMQDVAAVRGFAVFDPERDPLTALVAPQRGN